MTVDELAERLTLLVRDLRESGAPDEWLGEFIPSRGFGPFTTAERFRSLGRAWRLGVVLLDADGRLYSTGELTRAIEPGRAAVNRSPLGERRRSLRLAAARTFPTGDVVNFGYQSIDIAPDAIRAQSGPLATLGDHVVVRLEPGDAGITDLERYLADRLRLLEGGPDEAFA